MPRVCTILVRVQSLSKTKMRAIVHVIQVAASMFGRRSLWSRSDAEAPAGPPGDEELMNVGVTSGVLLTVKRLSTPSETWCTRISDLVGVVACRVCVVCVVSRPEGFENHQVKALKALTELSPLAWVLDAVPDI
jgi:hypothetical protein